MIFFKIVFHNTQMNFVEKVVAKKSTYQHLLTL